MISSKLPTSRAVAALACPHCDRGVDQIG